MGLSGSGIPEVAEAGPVPGRSTDRQAIRPQQRICRTAQTVGSRTHAGLAQQVPRTGQGLGEPQSQDARLSAARLHSSYSQKAMQELAMFPDELLRSLK